MLDTIVTVSEVEIAGAVRLAAESSRLVVEPSGALGIAAMAFHSRELRLDRLSGSIVAVVSGGNVDPADYRGYLEALRFTDFVPPEQFLDGIKAVD